MYFGYMFLASYAFAVGTGTIGFGASFFFVRKIYASIKVRSGTAEIGTAEQARRGRASTERRREGRKQHGRTRGNTRR